MSTEQITLSSSIDSALERARQQRRDRLADEGAVYRGSSDRERTAGDVAPNEGCCRECGEAVGDHVSHAEASRIKRVLGDDHGRVAACPECSASSTYAGAVKHAHEMSGAGWGGVL